MARLALLAGLCIGAASAVSLDQSHTALSAVDADMMLGDRAAAQATLHSMSSRMLADYGKKPRTSEIMHSLAGHVNLKSAAHRLQQKHLPKDVLALVSSAATGHSKKFDETSLAKARNVLNDMVQSSQAELDSKIIDCQTFKEANRGTYDQIEADLSRLASQIADLERLKLEANNGISKTREDIKQVKADKATAQEEYERQLAIDQADLRVMQNDLDVFQFILEFTKCETAASLLQEGHARVNVCEAHDTLVMDFGNKETQKKYERLMTPAARREIAKVLGEVRAVGAVSLLQVSEEPGAGPEKSTTYAPIMSATVPVLEGSGENGAMKCPPTPPDCGLLHDKMSMMWGVYKDQVDEQTEEMDHKATTWAELEADFNKQLELLTNSMTQFEAQLAEATANLNSDNEEKRAKYEEKLVIEAAYEDYMGKCKVRIEWILFQDICAIVVVRNAVLVDSTVCPTAGIVDCDVEDWIPGMCTVSCDDTCPHKDDPFACGGWQTLLRRVIVKPNECGLLCPELTYQKKCNQIKCPVDCVMSEFSDWSKCTKDCEGGVQQRSRAVMTNARNGGEFCDVPTEERACNTGSCDRNCELADWTVWTPCSMACTPAGDGEEAPQVGFKKRVREVVIPTRGFGECPAEESDFRLENEDCNTHACSGDEECYALQDLVMAIDGSGSITEDNFEILKEYVVKLVGRYKGEVQNTELVKIGIVQFGNGEIGDDGIISAAIKVLPLTSDMAEVATQVSNLAFLKGFTNMAQAFAIAEPMFTEAGRADAMSAVLTITDGRPSFAYQTQGKVDELEQKGIQRYFITIQEEEGKEVDLMKKWASEPWYTNHIHIPGFLALQSTNDTFVQQAVVMFCPNSQAPEVCHATAYQHARFMGWAADFPEGGYKMQEMIAGGAANDDMSSVKVWGSECVATLYQHWDFSGYAVDYPEGWYDFRDFLKQGARNDDISSLNVWRDIPYTW